VPAGDRAGRRRRCGIRAPRSARLDHGCRATSNRRTGDSSERGSSLACASMGIGHANRRPLPIEEPDGSAPQVAIWESARIRREAVFRPHAIEKLHPEAVVVLSEVPLDLLPGERPAVLASPLQLALMVALVRGSQVKVRKLHVYPPRARGPHRGVGLANALRDSRGDRVGTPRAGGSPAGSRAPLRFDGVCLGLDPVSSRRAPSFGEVSEQCPRPGASLRWSRHGGGAPSSPTRSGRRACPHQAWMPTGQRGPAPPPSGSDVLVE
jgi:hypothetical protein